MCRVNAPWNFSIVWSSLNLKGQIVPGMIEANRPDLQSWVNVPADSDFPIQNLFGIFSTCRPQHATRSGHRLPFLDLHAVAKRGLLDGLGCEREDFAQSTLNAFIDRGKAATRAVRGRVSK